MKRNPKTDKILITVPFWAGDKAQAMQLARLLADLEPGHSERFDFAFVARHDCKHDKETVGHVSKTFNTHTITSPRSETGWPNGCNGTFFGTVEWCLRGISKATIPAYKAIFVCEADVVPMNRDSLLYLHLKWGEVSRRGGPPPIVAGALVPAGPHGHAHINGGCCLLSAEPEFLFWLVKRVGGVMRTGGGWDWALASEFKMKGWADIPGIQSHWRRPSFDESEWQRCQEAGIYWLHGVKDTSLLNVAAKKLLA